MAVKKHKKDSTKRFGPRYGRRLKEKLADVEKGHLGKNKCPHCGKKNVKKIALGIWFCKSCKTKFAGKAYSLSKKIIIKEENDKIIKPEENTKKGIENGNKV